MITILIVALIVAIVIIFFLLRQTSEAKYTNVKIGYTNLRAEVADNNVKIVKGLMFRDSLKKDEAMIFVFKKSGYHGIWMMNMRFPIDIIWLNASKKVVSIKKDAQPCTINCKNFRPSEPAKYVLEVNSGFAEKNLIKKGSVVEFSLK